MKKYIGAIVGVGVGLIFKTILDKMDKREQAIREYEQMDMGIDPGIPEPERSWHDPSYLPQAVWICDHCNSLLQFHDTRESMQKHIDEVKDCDGLICPQCNEYNEIDDWTRKIMNQ